MATSPPALVPHIDLLREQRYRKHFLHEDRRHATIVFATVGIAFLLAVPNSFVLLDARLLLGISVASNLLVVASLGCALVLLWRARWPRVHDQALHLGLAAMAVFITAGYVTRIPRGFFIGPLIATGVLLVFLYFVLRGAILPRVITGSILSIATITVVFHAKPPVELPARVTTCLALVALNVVGILSARAFEENRRRRFDAERRERHARQQLAIQMERAEAASRARAAFLAAMSHEFRTPMNAVIGLSDVLLDAPLAKEHLRHVRTINESARALLGLLEEILDFAKIDANKLDLSLVPFDMRMLATSVVEMLQPQAKRKSLELVLNVSTDVPKQLVADDVRLRQVLVNLLSNAIKFTEHGRVTLDIASRPTHDKQHELTVQVKDTGVGMTPEVIGRLFRPFEQADVGITRRYGGTGLGLAISKRIVQAMGGDIRVDSELGIGSTFTFQIRLEMAPDSDAMMSPAMAEQHFPLTILVVDDNEINRDVARARFEHLGYPIDLAPDGPNAIEAAVRKKYDVIFMDLGMPHMSGIEATERIVKDLAGKDLPHIVALTASVFEDDREACRRAGMCDLVGKPIDPAQIRAVLHRIAKERGIALTPVKFETPIALEQLAALRELEALGEPGFVVNLCRLFLSELDKRVPRMTEAFEQNDAKAIEEDAHSLKSASAALGAMNMSELCARIERAARAGEMAEIPALLDAVALERRSVERALPSA